VSNPALAPRVRTCRICKEVGALEHVALLMYTADGGKLPPKPVTEYLRSIGMSGTPRQLSIRVGAHRKHIDRWLSYGAPLPPAAADDGVIHVPAPTGDQRWIDVNQNAMNIGNDALRDLNVRLASGEMETKEVIALAKLGVNAATNRGALEQKGRALNGIDRLLQLAAGGVGNVPQEG
jgi:hypothetical protein